MAKQIFQRISCFALVICVLFSCSVPAYAASIGEVSGFLTAVKDFGEWFVPFFGEASNQFVSIFNHDVCPQRPEGGARHEFVQQKTQVNGQIGTFYICKYCGKYAGDAFNDAYSSYVSTLDSPAISSTSGGYWVDMTKYNSDASTGSVLDSLEYFKATPGTYSDSWSFTVCLRYYFTVPVSGTYTLDVGYTSYGFNLSRCYVVCVASDGSVSSVSGPNCTGTSSGTSPAITYICSGKSSFSLSANSQYYLELSGRAYFDDLNYAEPRWARPHCSILSSAGVSVSGGDYSTRTASLMHSISNYNTTNNTINYYIGTTDANGNVNNVYDPDIFSETTKTFTEPVTGQQYLCTDWTYAYTPAIRGYRLDLAEGTYNHSGTDIRTIMLLYLDDALYIIGFKETALELEAAGVIGDNASVAQFCKYAVFARQYAYVVAERTAPEVCDHIYTSETVTAPTCTEQGLRRYTCELCGHIRDEDIPATGHAWEATETFETELNENGDVTKLGYTVYTCSACGEIYKQYDNTGQPGPPGGSTGSPTEESWFSWLASLFKKLISAIVNGLASGLEYLVENVIVTVTDLLIQFTRWAFGLLDVDSLTDWFNWFSDNNEYFANDFGGNEVDVWAYS